MADESREESAGRASGDHELPSEEPRDGRAFGLWTVLTTAGLSPAVGERAGTSGPDPVPATRRVASVDRWALPSAGPLWAAGAVAVTYYLGSQLGAALRFPSLPVSTFFPSSAILLAVFLSAERRAWPTYLLAVIPAHLLTHMPRGVPASVMLVQLAGNVGLALLGALVLSRLVDEPRRFDRLRTMTLFILVGGIAVPTLVSLAVVVGFARLDWVTDLWPAWHVRSLSNALAVLTFTPLTVLTLDALGPRGTSMSGRRIVEAGALSATLVAMGTILFVTPPAGLQLSPPLLYAPLPLLLWATVRFGVGGVCVSVLILGTLSLWGTLRGHGPFDAALPAQNVTSLLLFLNIVCAPLLVLAALLEERRQAGAALRESEERFRLMADVAPVMIWRSTVDSRYDFFNKPWLEFAGSTMEQALGHSRDEGVHADDLERCRRTYREAFDACVAFRMEYRRRRFDGEYRWTLDTGVPRFAPDGHFAGYIGSCIEITELKQAELEVQEQRRELAHLTRVAILGELSSTLAHELNQPLTAILSNAQAAQRLLAGPSIDVAEVREILADIVADDRRAGDVIGRVRTLVKKDDARIQFQALDVAEIVRETLGLVQGELAARQVTVSMQVANGLPAVRGDRVQLQQVVLNLAVNAYEAMTGTAPAERSLTVSVAATDEDRVVQVTVQDHGDGIPADMLDRLFEPFVTTKEQGLGLGLRICRSIITAHGGRLWVANNADRGATFSFVLPAS